jgi:hypothetical protein
MFSDGEERYEAHDNIQYSLVLDFLHANTFDKKFAFTENQRCTMLQLASLYVLCFLASSSSSLLPSKPQYMWLVQATAASSSEIHYSTLQIHFVVALRADCRGGRSVRSPSVQSWRGCQTDFSIAWTVADTFLLRRVRNLKLKYVPVSFTMPVFLSACNNSRTAGRTFIKFDIGEFY